MFSDVGANVKMTDRLTSLSFNSPEGFCLIVVSNPKRTSSERNEFTNNKANFKHPRYLPSLADFRRYRVP